MKVCNLYINNLPYYRISLCNDYPRRERESYRLIFLQTTHTKPSSIATTLFSAKKNQQILYLSQVEGNPNQVASNINRLEINLSQVASNSTQVEGNINRLEINLSQVENNSSQVASNSNRMTSNSSQSTFNLSQLTFNLSRIVRPVSLFTSSTRRETYNRSQLIYKTYQKKSNSSNNKLKK